jgi:hypothetical protein
MDREKMTGTNHVLTGALIGLTLQQPLIAIPVAAGSHFVLDALPHYGNPDHTSRGFLTLLAIDSFCILAIIVLFTAFRPENWIIAVISGLAAASPDLLWLPYWLGEMAGKGWKKSTTALDRFHKRIQWSEKPYNWPMEALWALLILTLLVKVV